MSIFDRLYHIIRSQIPSQDSHEREPSFKNPEPEFDSENHRGFKEQQRQSEPPPHPPEVDKKLLDYYANLEVSYGANIKEVQASYRRLMRKYHPDLHNQDEKKREIAGQITSQLNEAYDAVLKHLNQK